MAATGMVNNELLDKLNKLDYYRQAFPKSLANDFGTATVYPLIQEYQLSAEDALRTYVEHIALQVKHSVQTTMPGSMPNGPKLLITGGGAFNTFLVGRIREQLKEAGIEAIVPGKLLVNYKEALIMALIGVLRWREEYNVLSSVTGASRNSINGALWLGGEA
jgi:anhydro-N-acetylmuramic acid kinase